VLTLLFFELLRSLHTGSWFSCGSATELPAVKKGGRQGCRFGGVIFNMAYSRALKKFLAEATAKGIPVRLKVKMGAPPGTLNGEEDEDAIVFDITFVDDEAVILTAAVPKTLIKKLEEAIKILVRVFGYYGMRINWKPGKTEVMVALRGRGARNLKSQMAESEGIKKLTIQLDASDRKYSRPDDPDHIDLNVVDRYKHLGTIIDISGSYVPEARSRVRSAMSSFGHLATRVLGNKHISLKRRINLAWSLVMSRLFFNTQIWSPIDSKTLSILNAMHMRVWRRVVGQPCYEKSEMSNLQIRQKLGVPSLDCHLRQKRLLYLSRLARADIPALHAALQTRGLKGEPMPWVQQIFNDINIMCAHPDVATKVANMPSASADLQKCFNLARDFPTEWKALVKKFQNPPR